MSSRIVSYLRFASICGSFSLLPTALLSQQQLLASHLPAQVKSGTATVAGHPDSKQSLQLAITLPLRNEEKLHTLLTQLNDPTSGQFHRYLSTDQFNEQFGPSAEDYATVQTWVTSKGLSVKRTSASLRLLDVEGSVDAINSAFGVSLTNYKDGTTGRIFYAPDREPTVDLSVPLQKVIGLDNSELGMTNLRIERRVPFTREQAAPGSSNATGSGPGGNFLPSDMRIAYYGTGNLTGSGQIVGIFSLDGYLASDLSLYFQQTGMANTVPITNILVNGFNGDCYSDSTIGSGTCVDDEQIIDIAQVMGMAPGLSSIRFYEGTNTADILDQMAGDNSIGLKVITSSWYNYEFSSANVDSYFMQFQAQGQTYVSASGDYGAYNYGGSSSYAPPEDDPYITQVGGTELTTAGAGGAWQSEIGWPDSGGGYESGISIPSYQQSSGVINSSNGGSTTLRNSPDVAAEANTDNAAVSNGVFYTGYGGTSFAAPRWAGLIALANQQAAAANNSAVGFLNNTVYQIGTGSSYSADFHDVTSGNNGFPAVVGYDLVTGWGSPIGPALINQLTSAPTQIDWSGGADAATNSCTPYIGQVYMGAVQKSAGSDSWTISTNAGGTVVSNGYSITDSLGTLGSGTISGGNGVISVSRAPVAQPTVSGVIAVTYPSSSGRGTVRCAVNISFQPQ